MDIVCIRRGKWKIIINGDKKALYFDGIELITYDDENDYDLRYVADCADRGY
jgi:hypothetical protein